MGLLSGGSGCVGAERELRPVRFENGRRRRRARALALRVGGETNPTAAATRGALVCGMSAGARRADVPLARPRGAPREQADAADKLGAAASDAGARAAPPRAADSPR